MKTRDKILVATPINKKNIGGPGTFLDLLLDSLDSDYKLQVVSFDEIIKYPKVIRHFIFFLKALISSIGVKYILVLDTFSVALPIILVSRILNKKIILRVPGDFAWEQFVNQFKSDISLEEFISLTKLPFKIKLYRFVQYAISKQSKKIIVPSLYLKKIVMAWGIDGEKIVVIYNNYNSNNFNLSCISPEAKSILSSGRLVKWKGFSCLIDVMKELPNYKMYIAGDGPDEEALRYKIIKNKLESRVFLLGKLSKYELYKKTVECELFILNTGYEGMSHQLLEVMALKRPIMTTSIGGNLEILSNNITCLMFEYNNAEQIKNLILNTSEEDLKCVAESAFQSLNKFDRGNIIEEIRLLFKNI